PSDSTKRLEGHSTTSSGHVEVILWNRAALGTGANQVGSAPSNGAAAKVRKPIPGQRNPVKEYGFCFGFGADGVGLDQKLHDKFAGENGFGDGPITE
ncbi:unnamed protein product, partial [Ectocarpus sp. 4 AP-2014]